MKTIDVLLDIRLLCLYGHPLTYPYRGEEYKPSLLRGISPWGQDWTKYAEAYPLGLADRLAAAAVHCSRAAGALRRFDAEAFAAAARRRAERYADAERNGRHPQRTPPEVES